MNSELWGAKRTLFNNDLPDCIKKIEIILKKAKFSIMELKIEKNLGTFILGESHCFLKKLDKNSIFCEISSCNEEKLNYFLKELNNQISNSVFNKKNIIEKNLWGTLYQKNGDIIKKHLLKSINATPLIFAEKEFLPQGYSCFFSFEKSHFGIHTFPENNDFCLEFTSFQTNKIINEFWDDKLEHTLQKIEEDSLLTNIITQIKKS